MQRKTVGLTSLKLGETVGFSSFVTHRHRQSRITCKNMAKALYKGIVVGGDTWEISKKEGGGKVTGFSYIVLTTDDSDEKTGLCKNVGLVYVGTESKQYDKSIVYGDEVEFYGEFQPETKFSKAKMRYWDLKKVSKGGK